MAIGNLTVLKANWTQKKFDTLARGGQPWESGWLHTNWPGWYFEGWKFCSQ